MSSPFIALQRLSTEFSKLALDDAATLPGLVAAPRRDASSGEANMLLWDFCLTGPAGSPYEAGLFTGTLTFPRDYPLSPPRMVFSPAITHPNVYGAGQRAGEVCISILHAGADATGYERPEERWTAVHSVRSVCVPRISGPGGGGEAVISRAKISPRSLSRAQFACPRKFALILALAAALPPPPLPLPLPLSYLSVSYLCSQCWRTATLRALPMSTPRSYLLPTLRRSGLR